MKSVSPPSSQPGSVHQRKIHYIDHVLQKRLLVALVLLEILIVSAAGAFLYYRLNAMVEDSLYRIHFGNQPSMLSVWLRESLLIVAGMVGVNLLVLFMADRIWAHYTKGILLTLRDMLSRTKALDLGDYTLKPHRHKVLDAALEWRRVERSRHLALQQSLQILQGMAGNPTPTDEAFRTSLLALREHLPIRDPSDSRPAHPS